MTATAASRPDAAEDAALVARAARGDDHAFDELFRKYVDYVYTVAHGIVLDEDEARDVTQDVFLCAHRALHGFRGASRFDTWLFRIATNRAVDRVRSLARRRWLPIGPIAARKPDPAPGPSEALERSEQDDAVHAILRMLPVRHREVLALRYLQNLSIEEIAVVLGVPYATAKVRVHRARAAFKEKYVAEYPNDAE